MQKHQDIYNKMKTCTKCKQEKSISEFYKSNKGKNGLRSICKICDSFKNKEYKRTHKQHLKEYSIKTKSSRKKYKNDLKQNFPWKIVLHNIKYRCNNLNCKAYQWYGGRGIKCLITESELKQLWLRDKAYLLDIPSIDRINNDGNYEYSNCEFIELNENIIKSNKERYSFKI